MVRSCNRDLQLYSGDHLVELAASFYAEIFEFLGKAMAWFTQSRTKRLIKSFKEDFYEEFQEGVTEIRRLSDGIWRRAQQGANVENRETNLRVRLCDQKLNDLREQLRMVTYNMMEGVGRPGTGLCISNAEAFLAPTIGGHSKESGSIDDKEISDFPSIGPSSSDGT